MGIGSRFNSGGLFRCCIQTILEDDLAEYVGRKMTCPYCDAPMVVIQGVNYPEWQWDREAEVSIECISRSINAGLDLDDD